MKGFAISLLLSFTLLGFTQRATFYQMSVEDGLSQSSVECTFQDSRGLMWFGTRDGLNCYNGYDFKIYKHDKNDSLTLSNSTVYCLNEDYNGNIWVGAYGGINILNFDKQIVNRVILEHEDGTDFLPGRVFGIFRDDVDSVMWLCTANAFIEYDLNNDSYKMFLYDPDDPTTINDAESYHVIRTQQNRIFVTTPSEPLNEYFPKSGTFKDIDIGIVNDYEGTGYRKRLFLDGNGLMYIGAQRIGLVVYDLIRNSYKHYTTSNSNIPHMFTDGLFLKVSDNELWIGSDGGGIITFNPFTEEFGQYKQNLKISGSLNSNAVFTIYQSNDKIIWAGTFGGGLNIYDRNKYKFQAFRHNPDNPTSLAPNPVLAVYQDKKGRIWVGNDWGGLNLFDIENGTFEHIRHDPNDPYSLSNDIIVCINEDKFGNILMGTYAGGFMSMDPETRKVTNFLPDENDPNAITSLHIWNILLDSKGRNWLGLLTNGVNMYNPETQTFIDYGKGVDGIKTTVGNAMHINEDSEGKIWIGYEAQGLYIIDEKENKMSQWVTDPNNENSLSSNDVKCILFSNDYIYIATNGGGLNIYNKKTEKFIHFTEYEGLPSNAVMGLLMDKHQNLWITTTKGICKLNMYVYKNEGVFEFQNYTKDDGLAGDEFKYNAQCLLDDGRMLLGGIDGLTLFHPDSVRDNPNEPPIVFTDFRVMNKSVEIGGKNAILQRHINQTERIELNHNQNVFSIEFAALNYTASSRNEYKYMMDGFDKDWIEAGNMRIAAYTNLNAGKYTFKVIGSNNDGVWNDTPRTIDIRIFPPWYKTWWFYSIVALIVGYLIYLYVQWRERQAARDKAILEQKIKEGEKVIETKMKEVEEQKEAIRLRDIEEQEMRFQTNGIAIFSEILSTYQDNIKLLCNQLVSKLVDYLGANQGAIYIINDNDEDNLELELTGSFAVDVKKLTQKVFKVEEGHIGACFKDGERISMNKVPEGYSTISSGLGEKTPSFYVLIPLKQKDLKMGVIELAAFKEIEEYKLAFIEKVSENITATIAVAKSNQKAQELLDQANTQAEEMRAQEEEMRQNMEELLATQEEMSRSQDKWNKEKEALKAVESQLRDEIKDLTKELEGLRSSSDE